MTPTTFLLAITLLWVAHGQAGDSDNKPLLDAEQAFILNVAETHAGAIEIDWQIAPGYYLYDEMFRFALQDSPIATHGDVSVSAGEIIDDPNFGRLMVHRNQVHASLQVRNVTNPTHATLRLIYQGCSDSGVCYLPVDKEIPVQLEPGRNNPLTHTAKLSSSTASIPGEFTAIKGMSDLTIAAQQAVANRQITLLDITDNACASCEKMRALTFSDPKIQNRLQNIRLIRTDVSNKDKADRALLDHIGIDTPPAIFFFDAQGREIVGSRVLEFMAPIEFNKHLQTILAE